MIHLQPFGAVERSRWTHPASLVIQATGVIAGAYIAWKLGHSIVNAVNYSVESVAPPVSPVAFTGPAVYLLAWGLLRPKCERSGWAESVGAIALIVIAALWLVGHGIHVVSFGAATAAMAMVLWGRAGRGDAGFSAGDAQDAMDVPPVGARAVGGWLERGAFWLLALAIAAATWWHAAEQVRLWQHFMLGYADFGLFTTELEHCLPYKDVGSLRFADSRLGYHAVFFFYLLAPLYALFRSPIFLMVVGPLALNLAAMPAYWAVARSSGNRAAGLLAALAWLALPSITRLPYANTYGFQSVYLAVPWIAGWVFLAAAGRWSCSHACLAVALLCEETVCGVAFGWGVFLLVFGGRRRDGVVIMAASLGYLVLATQVIIPAFSPAETYTRLKLFGELSPGLILARLTRARAWLYMLAIAAPLLPWLWRQRRMLIAVVPTLLLVCLMQEDDYLNIKYWHQSTILPLVFAAAVIGIARSADGEPSNDSTARPEGCAAGGGSRTFPRQAIAMLAMIVIYSQWMGWWPLSQPRRVAEAAARRAEDDPRVPIVRAVRRDFPRDRYVVIATERLAAHFMDYRSVISLASGSSMPSIDAATLLIVDRLDHWDAVVSQGQLEASVARARAFGFTLVHSAGTVDVYVAEALDATLKRSRHSPE